MLVMVDLADDNRGFVLTLLKYTISHHVSSLASVTLVRSFDERGDIAHREAELQVANLATSRVDLNHVQTDWWIHSLVFMAEEPAKDANEVPILASCRDVLATLTQPYRCERLYVAR